MILNYNESNIKKKRRKNILDKSMDLFIRDGIHSLTMQDIAKECGISIRSLYYYYSTKEDLAVDIQICVFTNEWFNVKELDINTSGYELLKKLVFNVVDHIENNKKIIKYITAFDYYFHNEYPSEKYLKHLEDIQSNTIIEKIVTLTGKDNTINTHGESIETTVATIFQSILAYSQRAIYREKALLSEGIVSLGSLRLHAELLVYALKK